MNEERINQIKDQIRELMRQITEIGEEPPEFIQDLLLQVIERAQTEIAQLRQQAPETPEPPPQEPISNDAQLLWILAGQQEQAFISYLRSFPSPATQSLLNNPTLLSHTIAQLNRMMPQGQLPMIGDVEKTALNSSNVWGTHYDQKSGKLKVRFNSGSVYEYDGVPANIYRAFIHGNADARTNGQNEFGRWWRGKNPSLGAALNQYIKAGGFPYRRIR